MASIPLKQSKFSAGEVSPIMYGDHEWPRYGHAARLCQNWIPLAQGPLLRRPGTKYVASTASNDTARLVPFIFSDSRSYALEFTNLLMRVYRNGALVGAPFTLVTPFTKAMLPYLKFSQVGNTITICYGGELPGVAALAPRDVVHVGSSDIGWTIAATPLAAPAYPGLVAPFIRTRGAANGAAPAAWDPVVTYSAGDRVTRASGGGTTEWVSIQNVNLNNVPPAPAVNAAGTGLQGSIWWTPSIDNSHPAVSNSWVSTLVFQDSLTGVTYESAPSPVLNYNGPLSADRSLIVGMAFPAAPAGYSTLYAKLYRGTNDVYGLLYSGPNGYFIDLGGVPDFSQQPPAATNPFTIPGYPATICHHDQRRVWADAASLPQTMFFSKLGDLYNYDRPTPGADTDALVLTLASDKLHQIRSLVGLRRLLVMTGLGEWVAGGAQAAAITRTSQDVRCHSEWGSGWLSPVPVGNGVIFNSPKNNMVRDFMPVSGFSGSDVWDGDDLSWQARHLLDNHTISAWAFQKVPFPVLWIVRDDGVLLSLTYDKKAQVLAWAQHGTGAGYDKVEDVCVVPEDTEDAVYMVVNRTIPGGATTRHVERLTPLNVPFISSVYTPSVASFGGVNVAHTRTLAPDVRYGVYLDDAISYDGHKDPTVGANWLTMDSVAHSGSADPADYAVGTLVNLLCASGPFVASDAGTAEIRLDPENVLGQGSVTVKIVAYTNATTVVGELQGNLTATQVTLFTILSGGSLPYWGLARSIYAATHLTGQPLDSSSQTGARGVSALGDGNHAPLVTWAAGVATLPNPALVVSIGLLYNSDFVPMDAWHPAQEMRNRFKSVSRIGFEVAGSRGLWVGKDFDHLQEWQQRTVSDSYSVLGLATGYYEEFVTGEWDKTGRVALRQYAPLPVTLLSVLREIQLGGT